jgi:hypothetical protein
MPGLVKPQLSSRIQSANGMRAHWGRCTWAGRAILVAIGFTASLAAQQPDAAADAAVEPSAPAGIADQSRPVNQRVFGVLPNYRTADGTQPFQPITAKRKMYIAYQDSTDWPVFPAAAAFAALYQLENQNPSFGQGMTGYGKRFAGAYADQAIGNFMTEGIMPSIFRRDPRYFRRGYGSVRSLLWCAATRIFVCKTDAGRPEFNFGEGIGNASAVDLSNAYYPEPRTASDNLQRLAISLATDSFSQVGKEFWPDIRRKLFRKKS